jgi:hypothetical protein
MQSVSQRPDCSGNWQTPQPPDRARRNQKQIEKKKRGLVLEVIKDGREVVARGLADTEPAACGQANEAARKAKLIA